MEILKCIAVDDEPHALELLEVYVDKIPFLQLYKTTTSPWTALKIIQEENIDLLFLDIQMNELTGLQLLDISNKQCPVIITSAYQEYALEGYQYQVSDYLLKPYSFDRFLKAVNKVRSEALEKNKLAPAPTIATPTSSNSSHIFVKGDAKNKFHQIKLADILYIEGLKNYVQFFCTKERVVTLQNMKYLEDNLPSKQFIRIHRSYIVNLDCIEKVEGHSIYINGQLLPVGQSYRDKFYEILQKRGLG